jgi:hypothetical protein
VVKRVSMNFRIILALLYSCAVLSICMGCHRASLQRDEKAVGALNALKKLDAATDTGTSYQNYSKALGETNYAVGEFLQSDSASRNKSFTTALEASMRSFEAAEDVWTEEVKAPSFLAYCSDHGLLKFRVEDLCRRYPELVTNVPGEVPAAGESEGFAIASTNFQVELNSLSSNPRNSSGIIFEIAIKNSFRRASAEIKQAQAILEGKPVASTSLDSTQLVTKDQESAYLLRQAQKQIESNR